MLSLFVDFEETTSALAFVFQLEHYLLTHKELENAIKAFRRLLEHKSLSECFDLLPKVDKSLFIGSFQFHVRDNWFCTLLILGALGPYHFTTTENQKKVLVAAVINFRPNRRESIHLLKLISSLIDLTVAELRFDLLRLCSLVALSPLQGFRQYAEVISKKVLYMLSGNELQFVARSNFLPLRGVPSSYLDVYLKRHLSDLQPYITRIIEMFENNIENREGGALYKIIVGHQDFSGWCQNIWPQFGARFHCIEPEGLLKYWIPITLAGHQEKALNFILTQPIPYVLKGCVLVEARKKRYRRRLKEHDLLVVEACLKVQQTRNLAFQIVTYDPVDVRLVKQFVSDQAEALDQDGLRSLQRLSECASRQLRQELYAYGKWLLRCDTSCLGSQLLEHFKEIETPVGFAIPDKLNERIAQDGSDFLLSFIKDSSKELSVQVSNVVRSTTDAITTLRPEDNKTLKHAITTQLNDIFSNHCNVQDMFRAALLLESLHITYSKSLEKECYWIEWYQSAVHILTEGLYRPPQALCPIDEWLRLKSKSEKVAEFLFTNVCRFVRDGGAPWKSIVEPLVNVITTSGLRKSSTDSASLLKYSLMKSCESDKESVTEYQIRLLEKTMNELEGIPMVQTSTIRRNPEVRLIIHAVCAADCSPQKTCLMWSLRSLLDFLHSDVSLSSDSSVAAALHSTELLISDQSLHEHTLKFVPSIILTAIKHFQNRNWIVRNACVQLEKALIDRFLGVSIGTDDRSRSAEELFLLFPSLASEFIRVLSSTPLTDSVLGVLLFFSESQAKLHSLSFKFCETMQKTFACIFIDLIKTQPNLYGSFAARAYASLCLRHQIALHVDDVVDYITTGVRRCHIVGNCLLLLHLLNAKAPESLRGRAEASLKRLAAYLRLSFDVKLFDLLSVKVESFEAVWNRVVVDETDWDVDSFEVKLWLRNYVPFLLRSSPAHQVPLVLKAVVSRNLPECIQVEVLKTIVDKRMYLQENVFTVLALKALNLKKNSEYLSMWYFKVAFGSFQNCKTVEEELLFEVRSTYHDNSLYKTFISLLILSKVPIKNAEDCVFMKEALGRVQDALLQRWDDEDFIDIASKMLPYLDTSCDCAKATCLRLALGLAIGYGKVNFVGGATPLRTVKVLLNHRFLTSYFSNELCAFRFVKQFYIDAVEKRGSEREETTFYAKEREYFVDAHCIKSIVIEFLKKYF